MLVIAHRGASVAAAENTVDAFRLADEFGADGVETDVRLSPGGRLVVSHDAVADLDAMLPFADGLDACGDRMLVNVEIKNSVSDGGFDPTCEIVPLVVDELDRRGAGHRHRWLVSSFSWATLEAVRRVAPELPTAWLCNVVDDARRHEVLDRVVAAGHRALHPWEGAVTDSLVTECHEEGLAVNVWTSNDPTRLRTLDGLGVDGVCTDVPDIGLGAVGRSPAATPRWTFHQA